ncbi:hypothetical protein VSS74_01560 [Conexibacter stalactiti]|uniref:ParB/Sulfiredoxin domain-containing protein n=1 Tax=Conexibacter stalactiti TaxID=1940611 RepID=A0ABU4HI68_9ACTN|nr:hypothetical protein [Conexibacter stalactiti]MDW5593005.1 hypothetical protein [Conexibacter stalactiti]MEC5033646.1 hypothetical protein [Conexibacter stalactiti]
MIEAVPLAQIRLAPNPRKRISDDGLVRLARMMMTVGQKIPAIGRRLSASEVLLYEGQRRFLSAGRSVELAGSEGFEELKPIGTLCVILLDHEPTPREIRQLQAHANAREDLTVQDQQDQFDDVWKELGGLPDEQRILGVCDELALPPVVVHNLRRQCTLPEELRGRVAKEPSGDQISITLANQLAEMNATAPALTQAVGDRVVSAEHERQARDDFGAFVHRTVVEGDGAVYAQRIDEGAHLEAAQLLVDARRHLDDDGRERLGGLLGSGEKSLDTVLEELTREARERNAHVVVDEHVRDRASNGKFAWTLDRGRDYARGIWVVDPVFMIGLINEQMPKETVAGQDESYFAAAGVSDEDVAAAQEEDRKARAKAKRDRHAAASANLALGLDISAKLLEPTEAQVRAGCEFLMRLLARDYVEVIAFGAGWTDRDRQQPVGAGERTAPRSPEVIIDAELTRALEHRDPVRGLLSLLARFGAAFVLDPNGVSSSKHLGAARTARHLSEALPGGRSPMRSALWQLMAPMLNPHLTVASRDAFVFDELAGSSTVDLAERARERDLADVDLGDESASAIAA